MNLSEKLKQLKACDEAIIWVRVNNYSTLKEAWYNCPHGHWMLWFAKKKNIDLRKLTLAKGLCANLARDYMKDERSRRGVDTAIAFGRGQATYQELEAAYRAACDATDDAYATYTPAAYAPAAYAGEAAADAYADATKAATKAANAYAANAYAATEPADTYAAYDAYAGTEATIKKYEILAKCADICRETLTDEIMRL